jgi:hypothetical protein
MSVVAQYGLYCLVYISAVLTLGVALFQTRQLEAQETSASLPGAVGLLAWAGRAGAAAMLVAGIVCLSFLWLPKPSWWIGPAGAGLLVAGVLEWALWGYFMRAIRWSYWVMLARLTLVVSALAVGLVMVQTSRLDLGWIARPAMAVLGFAVVGVLHLVALLTMIMPGARRHFRFGRARKSSSGALGLGYAQDAASPEVR